MATHYRVRQKLVAIGDDFWIENERGERAYRVDGKALRLRKTLVFEDVSWNELCTIQEHKLRIRDSMEIEDPRRSAIGNGQEGAHRVTAGSVRRLNQPLPFLTKSRVDKKVQMP